MNTQSRNILNNFKDILGEYCAINQFVELSKRCFTLDHAVEISTRNRFIELATQNQITLTCYDADKMLNVISRSYIVNVHLCFETFLIDLYHNVRKFGVNDCPKRIEEESRLHWCIKNITGFALPEEKKALCELCEYYRLVRNTAVHDLCDVKSHNTEYRKLLKYNFKTDAKFAKLEAPNEYDKISFDDFVLFSRACVELATYLFDSVVYDYEKIVRKIPKEQLAKMRTYTDTRLEQALNSYFNTQFKVDNRLENQMPKLKEIIRA